MVRWDMYKDNGEDATGKKIRETTTNNYNRLLLGLNWNCLKNTRIMLNYHHFFYNNKFKEANGYNGNNQIQLMAQFNF